MGKLSLQQDMTRVDLLLQFEGRNTGYLFSIDDGPVDRAQPPGIAAAKSRAG